MTYNYYFLSNYEQKNYIKTISVMIYVIGNVVNIKKVIFLMLMLKKAEPRLHDI